MRTSNEYAVDVINAWLGAKSYNEETSVKRAALVIDTIRAEAKAEAEARVKELESELATPILVSCNRLADSLADVRMENEKLRARVKELEKLLERHLGDNVYSSIDYCGCQLCQDTRAALKGGE